MSLPVRRGPSGGSRMLGTFIGLPIIGTPNIGMSRPAVSPIPHPVVIGMRSSPRS